MNEEAQMRMLTETGWRKTEDGKFVMCNEYQRILKVTGVDLGVAVELNAILEPVVLDSSITGKI